MSDTDDRGVLHRHEDGTEHRHWRDGFEGAGGMVFTDEDGTEDHEHGRLTPGDGRGITNRTGPVVWAETWDRSDG